MSARHNDSVGITSVSEDCGAGVNWGGVVAVGDAETLNPRGPRKEWEGAVSLSAWNGKWVSSAASTDVLNFFHCFA